jgi:hypothetical protein
VRESLPNVSAEPRVATCDHRGQGVPEATALTDSMERRASNPAPGGSTLIPEPRTRPSIVALAPERFKIQFTVGRETHDKFRRAQDLLRHVVPDGDPAQVFDRALVVLVAHLETQKAAATDNPRASRSPREHTRTSCRSMMAHPKSQTPGVSGACEVD